MEVKRSVMKGKTLFVCRLTISLFESNLKLTSNLRPVYLENPPLGSGSTWAGPYNYGTKLENIEVSTA